jgi:hypothetical protein
MEPRSYLQRSQSQYNGIRVSQKSQKITNATESDSAIVDFWHLF